MRPTIPMYRLYKKTYSNPNPLLHLQWAWCPKHVNLTVGGWKTRTTEGLYLHGPYKTYQVQLSVRPMVPYTQRETKYVIYTTVCMSLSQNVIVIIITISTPSLMSDVHSQRFL